LLRKHPEVPGEPTNVPKRGNFPGEGHRTKDRLCPGAGKPRPNGGYPGEAGKGLGMEIWPRGHQNPRECHKIAPGNPGQENMWGLLKREEKGGSPKKGREKPPLGEGASPPGG